MEKPSTFEKVGKGLAGLVIAGASFTGCYYIRSQRELAEAAKNCFILELGGWKERPPFIYASVECRNDTISSSYLIDGKGNRYELKDNDPDKNFLVADIPAHLPKGNYTWVIEFNGNKKTEKSYFLDPVNGVRKENIRSQRELAESPEHCFILEASGRKEKLPYLGFDAQCPDDISSIYLIDEKGNRYELKDDEPYTKAHWLGSIPSYIPKGNYAWIIELKGKQKIKKDYFLDPAKGRRNEI